MPNCSSDPPWTHCFWERSPEFGAEPQDQTPEPPVVFHSYFSSFAVETSVFPQSVSQPPCLFPRWSSSPHEAVVLRILSVFGFNYKFLIGEPRRTPAEQSPHGPLGPV